MLRSRLKAHELFLRRLHIAAALVKDKVSDFALIILEEFNLGIDYCEEKSGVRRRVKLDFILAGGLPHELAILNGHHEIKSRLKFVGSGVLSENLGID